jgi:hypothetical protein
MTVSTTASSLLDFWPILHVAATCLYALHSLCKPVTDRGHVLVTVPEGTAMQASVWYCLQVCQVLAAAASRVLSYACCTWIVIAKLLPKAYAPAVTDVCQLIAVTSQQALHPLRGAACSTSRLTLTVVLQLCLEPYQSHL